MTHLIIELFEQLLKIMILLVLMEILVKYAPIINASIK